MAQTRKHQAGDTTRGSRKPPAKIAVTLRLDAERIQRLQAVAETENRSLTNFVETVLLRDLSRRDEATRVIMMSAAPGTSRQVGPEDVLRAPGESDEAYAERQALLVELWSIPDGG